MLILVRHAMPALGPETPAHAWELSDAGHAAARQLAGSLPARPYLVASAEPKARQTLEAAGQVVCDERFNEIRRPEEPWEGDHRQVRRAYVGGVDHPGWEPRAQVAERFDGAVDEHLGIAWDRPLVVATHGMAMTVWLAARIGLPDPGGHWAGLRLSDAHRVDLASGTVTRIR